MNPSFLIEVNFLALTLTGTRPRLRDKHIPDVIYDGSCCADTSGPLVLATDPISTARPEYLERQRQFMFRRCPQSVSVWFLKAR